MTPERDEWTRADLERFHDGDLDGERAAELRAALLRDPSLRNLLADVRELDSTIRAGLTRVVPASGRRTVAWRRAGAVAASIALVGAALWMTSRFVSRGAAIPAPALTAARSAPEKAYEPIRVVLSIPVRSPRVAPAEPDSGMTVVAQATRGPEDAAVSYRAAGLSLRSAPAAEAFLNELSPSEQLRATRVWAANRTQPAVAFARLRELSARPELAPEVRVVLAELAADARLGPWLHAYQLIGLAAAPESMPSNRS